MADQKPAVTARWRKQPRTKGLGGVGQGARGMQLRHGENVIISVVVKREFGGLETGWYWYGLCKNTSDEPCQSMEEAKAQADAHYKDWKKSQQASEEAGS